jgi:hypothetical protein
MRRGSNITVLFIILLIVIVLFFQFRSASPNPDVLPINDLADEIGRGNVARLIVNGNDIEVMFRDGSEAVARKESGKTVAEQMVEFGVPADRLSSDRLEIRVEGSGILSESNLAVALVAGSAGMILGAGFVLLAQRARSSPA